MELVFRSSWWPQLWKYVKEFVGSSNVYVRANNLRHRFQGLFQPLPILASSCSSISMDFIIDFPPSNSYDSILVVVDHLKKMIQFIPCAKTSETTTKLFFDHVFRYHDFPKDIILDHGL
jgi:hypothetical protein